MSVHTRSQKIAQAAYEQIRASLPNDKSRDSDFISLAKKFPALIHTCGLAQSVAFAKAKENLHYLACLARTLQAAGHISIQDTETLCHEARNQSFEGYLRLSRDAINAASWLKRYTEATAPEESEEER